VVVVTEPAKAGREPSPSSESQVPATITPLVLPESVERRSTGVKSWYCPPPT